MQNKSKNRKGIIYNSISRPRNTQRFSDNARSLNARLLTGAHGSCQTGTGTENWEPSRFKLNHETMDGPSNSTGGGSRRGLLGITKKQKKNAIRVKAADRNLAKAKVLNRKERDFQVRRSWVKKYDAPFLVVRHAHIIRRVCFEIVLRLCGN